MPADTKNDSDAGGKLAIAALLFALAAVTLVPALVGLTVFLAARRFLGHREGWALTGVGVAGLALASPYVWTSYGHWLKLLAEALLGNGEWPPVLAEVPYLTLVLATCIIAGTLALLVGTKIGSKFGRVLPQHTTVSSGRGIFKRPTLDEDDLLNATTRQGIIARSAVVAPPGGALTVNASAHSVLNPQEPGKRTFPIGVDAQGSPLYLSEAEIRTHGLILGATGSGKSETIKALAGCLLDLGWSGLLLDLKEDTAPGGLRDWCHTYAQSHGTPYQELRLSDPVSPYWFNSLLGMGPDEMRDAVLALQEFEAAYYEALNKELLGQLINLMYWAHEADPTRFDYPTMYNLAKICGSASLPKATQAMRAVVLSSVTGTVEADFLVLSAPTKAMQEAATGFGSRLGNVFDTQAGRAVLRNNAEGTRINVDVTLPGLTYIGLDSQGKQDLTRVVSSSVMQRLSVYAAQRTVGLVKKDAPRFVIVDEANWINREITKNLLSRARSAGIALFLCTQGPKDWIDKTGDDWATLTQNINVAIVMRQGEPESATLLAEYFGKKLRKKTSERVDQTDGLLGERRVRDGNGHVVNSFTVADDLDYRIPPDTLRELTVGEAYIRVGAPDQRTVFARISMRDPKASPVR